MRKLALLAAAAAVIVPGAAVAQHHESHDSRGSHQGHNDQHGNRHDSHQNGHHNNGGNHHNRSHYVAPYRNWNYRPVAVGHHLQSNFYGSRYYINDYGSYHLRAPGRYQRWIRYGDDLLLVNVRTGRVLDVIHYRYW